MIFITDIIIDCNHHHHHHVVLPARISLINSRHFSLSFIASGLSSGLHPVLYIAAVCTFELVVLLSPWPHVGVHRSTSLTSSSLLIMQCPACLVRLTCIVFLRGGKCRIVGVFLGVVARTCSILLSSFLCSCRLASSPAV